MTTELTEIPDLEKFRGKLFKSIEPVEFEPKEVYDSIGLPAELRSKFSIKPMNKRQNHKVESDVKIASQLAIKWAVSKGISIKTISKEGQNQLDLMGGKKPTYKSSDSKRTDYSLFSAKMASYCDANLYNDIARENIVGINGGVYEYKKDMDGFLDIEVFNTIHDDIIESVAGEIQKISKLSSMDSMGL